MQRIVAIDRIFPAADRAPPRTWPSISSPPLPLLPLRPLQSLRGEQAPLSIHFSLSLGRYIVVTVVFSNVGTPPPFHHVRLHRLRRPLGSRATDFGSPPSVHLRPRRMHLVWHPSWPGSFDHRRRRAAASRARAPPPFLNLTGGPGAPTGPSAQWPGALPGTLGWVHLAPICVYPKFNTNQKCCKFVNCIEK